MDEETRTRLDRVLNTLLPLSVWALISLNVIALVGLWSQRIQLGDKMKRIALTLLALSTLWLINNQLRRELGLQGYQGALSKGVDFVFSFILVFKHGFSKPLRSFPMLLTLRNCFN